MRLVQGRNGWWCIGRSATALLPDGLVHNGDLTPEGRVQLRAAGIDEVPEPDHYSLTVVTSTGCNLGCSYCFQNTPDGRRRIAPARLDARNVARCLSFAEKQMAELGVRRLELLLFGGEPLLNPAGCLQVLRAFGARMPVTASMVSNGVLLTRRTAGRLAEAGLGHVQVTLDGERDQHDRTRVTRGGRPTFDLILANVAAAQQHTGLRFTLRVNVTPQVVPRLPAVLDQAAEVLDVRSTNLAIAPVLDYGAGVPAPDARAAQEAVEPARRRPNWVSGSSARVTTTATSAPRPTAAWARSSPRTARCSAAGTRSARTTSRWVSSKRATAPNPGNAGAAAVANCRAHKRSPTHSTPECSTSSVRARR
ncbi:radical SAM protein [Lentzea cavernae]|uniref:Radical SAM core domain-containing protein n=1 Tax=Lentzea cavernae TaxID=2020703 RepID=A0ABQ3MQP5_9PSEU|nr:radical SAM protein [Lentzea cavernae]GHH54342.1 hypothetical protein GCM10017774_69180 [Lentzea cavernae]